MRSKTDVAAAIGGCNEVRVIVPEEAVITSSGAEVTGGMEALGCGCDVDVTIGGGVVMIGTIGEEEFEKPVAVIGEMVAAIGGVVVMVGGVVVTADGVVVTVGGVVVIVGGVVVM